MRQAIREDLSDRCFESASGCLAWSCGRSGDSELLEYRCGDVHAGVAGSVRYVGLAVGAPSEKVKDCLGYGVRHV